MGKNWPTTVAGIIAGLGPILLALGIPPEVSSAISTIGLFLLGLLSKTYNVTGGTKQQ